jgi:hypothetical protein
MASIQYTKILSTAQPTNNKITLLFTPNESHMPVLVDFWRQSNDSKRTIEEVWKDLVGAYQGIAIIITPDEIVQELSSHIPVPTTN